MAKSVETSTAIGFYGGEFYVLSNFAAFRLYWLGHDFDTSEAAYQFCKFFAPLPTGTTDDDQAAIRDAILKARSAHDAFKIAEKHERHRRLDWLNVRVGLMRDILRAKLAQHEYVRRKLLQTGDRPLVENSWRDSFWGWGENQLGENQLGKLWMAIRAEIGAKK
jgi:ribA/ribD-fused uncharacterized protein